MKYLCGKDHIIPNNGIRTCYFHISIRHKTAAVLNLIQAEGWVLYSYKTNINSYCFKWIRYSEAEIQLQFLKALWTIKNSVHFLWNALLKWFWKTEYSAFTDINKVMALVCIFKKYIMYMIYNLYNNFIILNILVITN